MYPNLASSRRRHGLVMAPTAVVRGENQTAARSNNN